MEKTIRIEFRSLSQPEWKLIKDAIDNGTQTVMGRILDPGLLALEQKGVLKHSPTPIQLAQNEYRFTCTIADRYWAYLQKHWEELYKFHEGTLPLPDRLPKITAIPK